MILPIVRNQHNKFTVARVHYSADPDKATPEWIEVTKRGMSERGWLREYEIDYSSFAGKPYYSEFSDFNIAHYQIEYKSGETLYRGWDYGFHRPCCLITKLNEFDQWCWIKCILGQDESARAFGTRVRNFCLGEYPGAKFIDADDIAGTQKSDKSDQTSREILNALGIYPQGRKQEIKEGAEIIRQKLKIRIDGKPGLLVNPSETDVIDGFKGGIHYPQAKEGKPEAEEYEKDGYYDHIFDSGRYIGVEIFTLLGQKQDENDIAYDPMKEAMRMGREVSSADANDLEIETGTIHDYF